MVDNWDSKLTDFASEMQGDAFKWGKTDCGSLVRRALRICYGEELFRGSWRGRGGALEWVAETGGPAAALKAVGFKKINPPFAGAGTVVVLPGEDADDLPQTGIMLHRGRMLTADRLSGVTVYNLNLEAMPKKTLFLKGP